MTDVERYRKHLFELAHRHRLCVTESSQQAVDDAAADITNTVVRIPPVIDDTSYAVALHEMGHIVAKDGHGGWRANKHTTLHELLATAEHIMLDRLVEERAAWEWAQAKAIEWTAGMAQVRKWAEGDYYQKYLDTKQVLKTRAALEAVIDNFPAAMQQVLHDVLKKIDSEPSLWHHDAHD